MSKATPTQLQNMGFDATQFRVDSGFDAYLQEVLDDVALEVRERVGASVYDAASTGTLNEKRIRMAELYLSAAQLWRRIEAFERSDAIRARTNGGSAETISSRQFNNADEMEAYGWDQVTLITGDGYGSGIATGTVESGPFSSVVS